MVAELPFETLSEIGPTIESSLGPPQPHLFRVFECNRPLVSSGRHCLIDVDNVAIGRGERSCEREPRSMQLHLCVPDPWMSTTHARLLRRSGGWVIEDSGSRNGTLVNGAAVTRATVADGDVIELGRTFFLFRQDVAVATGEPVDLDSTVLSPIVAELASLNPSLAGQLRKLVQVADSSVSVIVQGETGTGKEQIARMVHALSRRPGDFVAVNCGALPATLVETELFGCRRGAFTGAQDRPGLIRAAERGTLFLDEVGELSLPAQVALLRVLQERQVLAVGATHPVAVDFRLLCATQEPLDFLVKVGRFRSDLLARLAGITARLPPLRERREDTGIITATLIRKLVPERPDQISFDKEAARALLGHRFPLNIRELQKCLESAIAMAGSGPIRLSHLPLDISSSAAMPGSTAAAAIAQRDPEDPELQQRLVALLDLHHGNVSAIARAMGKERVQIRRWLQRYGLDAARFRR